jgi:hypothetical protein
MYKATIRTNDVPYQKLSRFLSLDGKTVSNYVMLSKLKKALKEFSKNSYYLDYGTKVIKTLTFRNEYIGILQNLGLFLQINSFKQFIKQPP